MAPCRALRIEDHPRIRGEHGEFLQRPCKAYGSSPHTRGARTRPDSLLGRERIIPAYAGSTRRIPWMGRRWPGSSPHTRGARADPSENLMDRRIIPAYAGSTPEQAETSSQTTDHPRIRGEHRQRHPQQPVDRGSSPHTRGARQAILHVSSLARIIPAYAGSTTRMLRRSR